MKKMSLAKGSIMLFRLPVCLAQHPLMNIFVTYKLDKQGINLHR